jgi:uncharacterized membrane protein YkoI
MARASVVKARFDLIKAIDIAQQTISSGKPIYAITKIGGDKLFFHVYQLDGDGVSDVEIDSVTGEVKEIHPGVENDIESLPETKQALAVAVISFTHAIATAKSRVQNGKPFEIEYEIEDGKAVIEIKLLRGGKVIEVEIDAISGAVLEVE